MLHIERRKKNYTFFLSVSRIFLAISWDVLFLLLLPLFRGVSLSPVILFVVYFALVSDFRWMSVCMRWFGRLFFFAFADVFMFCKLLFDGVALQIFVRETNTQFHSTGSIFIIHHRRKFRYVYFASNHIFLLYILMCICVCCDADVFMILFSIDRV